MKAKKLTLQIATIMLGAFAAILFSAAFVHASIEPPVEQTEKNVIKGVGSYFEIVDSDYLNIVMSSSVNVDAVMCSIPETVFIYFRPYLDEQSAVITLEGFSPNHNYYKYDDNYHNETDITTDADGVYSFTQDISEPHLVIIQTTSSTIFITEDGWSDPSVGEWDPVSKTATLSRDLNDSIQIDYDGVALDGNGHSIIGPDDATDPFSGFGIFYNGTGITVKNVNVQGFSSGLFLSPGNWPDFYINNACENSIISYNYIGVFIVVSGENNIINNQLYQNQTYGIAIYDSSYNSTIGNIIYENLEGINLFFNAAHNIISNNIIFDSVSSGIRLSDCQLDTLINNTIFNNQSGIELSNWSNDHTILQNDIMKNGVGLMLGRAPDDIVYNNTFVCNAVQVEEGIGGYLPSPGGPTVCHLPLPIGGNYWDNWTTPDYDGDGFVDIQYLVLLPTIYIGFDPIYDEYPWTRPNGWLSTEEQVSRLLIFFDRCVEAEIIQGDGPGNSANGRLKAFTNMLNSLTKGNNEGDSNKKGNKGGKPRGKGKEQGLINKLESIYLKCDGQPHPPDFITGDAATIMALMIQNCIQSIDRN